MSTDLEVDDSSKTLIASWFGIESSSISNKDLEDSDDCSSDSLTVSNKKKKKDESSKKTTQNVHISNQNLQVFSLGLPKKKTMSGFVGEKLQKKLKKLKNRKENTEKDIQEKSAQAKKNDKKSKGTKAYKTEIPVSDVDDDDCSKVKMIEKTKKQPPVIAPYTVESLKKRLSDTSELTKGQRKRLKKKLNSLLSAEVKSSTVLKAEGKTFSGENSKLKEKTEEDIVSDIKAEKNKFMSKENGMKDKTKEESNDKYSESKDNKNEKVKNSNKRRMIEDNNSSIEMENLDLDTPTKKKKDDWNDGYVMSPNMSSVKKRKKTKRKNKNKLDESTASDISITKDIAIIKSPIKEVKTNAKKKGKERKENAGSFEGKVEVDLFENKNRPDIHNKEESRSKVSVHQVNEKKKNTHYSDNSLLCTASNSSFNGTNNKTMNSADISPSKEKKHNTCTNKEEKESWQTDLFVNSENAKKGKSKLKKKKKLQKAGLIDGTVAECSKNCKISEESERRIIIEQSTGSQNVSDTSMTNGRMSEKQNGKHKMDERTNESSSPKKSNFGNDKNDTEEDSQTEKSILQDDDKPKKKKKHKSRSRQKNIKKDHRPEHLKPYHLQQAGKDKK